MKYYFGFNFIIMTAFAVVQYNDPDAYHWICAYLFVGFVHFLKFKKKITRLSLILIAIPYLLWAIDLYPPQWEGLLLNEMGMKTINIELGRESLGLGFSFVLFIITSIIDKD